MITSWNIKPYAHLLTTGLRMAGVDVIVIHDWLSSTGDVEFETWSWATWNQSLLAREVGGSDPANLII